MNIAGSGAAMQSGLRCGGSLALGGKAKLACLGIDLVAENLSAVLMRAGAGKVETAIPDRPALLAVDGDEMNEAFATLGDAVAQGALVTILGDLVRIVTGETDGDKGCALLSVLITGGKTAEMTVVRDALSALRGVIRKQRGLLKVWEERGEMRISLYLPIVHSP